MRRVSLAPAHFGVLVATLVAVLAVLSILVEPGLRELYLREVVVPRLEEAYGFRGGQVTLTRETTTFEAWGILEVRPDGALARLGIRPGDAPTAYHGGIAAMHAALGAAGRKQFAAFDVVNADDWKTGRTDATRTIVVYPGPTDLPVSFRQPDGRELISPRLGFSLTAVEQGPGRYGLVVRNLSSSATLPIYSYGIHVAAVWSPDETWIALTDADDTRTPRCVLLDGRSGTQRNVADLAAELPAFRRDGRPDDHVACEVFGWVRGTSRVALTLWSPEGRSAAAGSYFLDTAAWTLIDARSD